ncbi:MAG: 2Fe-2S iron-sulfur cluster-binding protein [Nitrospiraceae bacterium]
MRLTVTVQRSHPAVGSAAPSDAALPPSTPSPSASTNQAFRLDLSRGLTVLDALIRIKNEMDGSLGLRYSCRSAICGSCAMTINGTEKLACRTSIRQEFERHGEVRIGPLRNLPVIKDLAVDMRTFWQKVRQVDPWIADSSTAETSPVPVDPATQQLSITPAQATYHNVDACIMCGACVAACTSHEVSRGFLGPAALAKADRIFEDPREGDAGKRTRLDALQTLNGIWDCVRCNYCVQVCPKDVKPMEAIVRLRRASIEQGIPATGGARHITGFVDLVERYGRLNEALMPLKVVGFEPRRLVSVVPLGLRMLVRGKVPNPFGHTISGIEAVRAIFRTTRQERRRVRLEALAQRAFRAEQLADPDYVSAKAPSSPSSPSSNPQPSARP